MAHRLFRRDPDWDVRTLNRNQVDIDSHYDRGAGRALHL